MRRALLIALLLIIPAGIPAAAQTVGPTPTDYPTDWITHTPDPSGTLIWTASPTPYLTPTPTSTVFVLNFDPFAPIMTPTVRPTWTPRPGVVDVELPAVLIYEAIATAAGSINEIPDRIGLGAFDGARLFAHAKWLFSARAADEVFGPFGILVSHVQFVFTVSLTISGIVVSIAVGRFIITMILWVINQIRRLLPL